MNFLPFEIYSAPLESTVYGHIWVIPNYLSEQELEKYSAKIDTHCPHGIPSDTYPNFSIVTDINRVSEKTRIITESFNSICDYIEDTSDYDYRFKYNRNAEFVDRESRKFLPMERVQGSPKGMKRYPPHSDMGKALTVLVPLRPRESVPTEFHGYVDGVSICNNCGHNQPRYAGRPVSIPWRVNHAYMFCSSEMSYHSYEGDKNNDRWILNFNLYPI